MKTVLVITNLLPVESIEKKKNENDILLITEDKIIESYSDIQFHYLFATPKVNSFLARISKKWKSYYDIQKKGHFNLRGRVIRTLGIIKLPKKLSFRKYLFQLSFNQDKKKLDAIIKEIKPTVIHAHSIDGQAFYAKKLSEKYGIPYIVTIRGIVQNTDKLVQNNLMHADKIIAISPTHKKIAENLLKKEVHFIPHGVAPSFFKSHPDANISSKPFFISVCRLIKLKNLDRVITALSKIKMDFIYNIYGDGPERENLQKLIESYNLQDKVQLKGFIKNDALPGELTKHNLFIMPSYPETLGRVYFEAMACGVPVLATKNTGVDGIVENGVEGFMIDVNDSQALDTVFSSVFSNTSQLALMSINARKLADNYRWEKITDKLYNLY